MKPPSRWKHSINYPLSSTRNITYCASPSTRGITTSTFTPPQELLFLKLVGSHFRCIAFPFDWSLSPTYLINFMSPFVLYIRKNHDSESARTWTIYSSRYPTLLRFRRYANISNKFSKIAGSLAKSTRVFAKDHSESIVWVSLSTLKRWYL